MRIEPTMSGTCVIPSESSTKTRKDYSRWRDVEKPERSTHMHKKHKKKKEKEARTMNELCRKKNSE